jgi:hypothetical protein
MFKYFLILKKVKIIKFQPNIVLRLKKTWLPLNYKIKIFNLISFIKFVFKNKN